MRKSLSCFFGLCLVTMVIYISWTQFRNPPPYQFLWHRVNVGVPILLRYIDIQKLLKNARWKIVVITMATLLLSLSIREYRSILGKEGQWVICTKDTWRKQDFILRQNVLGMLITIFSCQIIFYFLECIFLIYYFR